MTNCVKGDIARVTGMPAALADVNDRLVRCVEPMTVQGKFGWKLEEAFEFVCQADYMLTDGDGYGCRLYAGARYRADAIEDIYLRPIRDPGDEAQDETLSWLPSPMAEINAIKRGEVAHG